MDTRIDQLNAWVTRGIGSHRSAIGRHRTRAGARHSPLPGRVRAINAPSSSVSRALDETRLDGIADLEQGGTGPNLGSGSCRDGGVEPKDRVAQGHMNAGGSRT